MFNPFLNPSSNAFSISSIDICLSEISLIATALSTNAFFILSFRRSFLKMNISKSSSTLTSCNKEPCCKITPFCLVWALPAIFLPSTTNSYQLGASKQTALRGCFNFSRSSLERGIAKYASKPNNLNPSSNPSEMTRYASVTVEGILGCSSETITLYVNSLSWRTPLPPVCLLTNPNPFSLTLSMSISFFNLWKYPTDNVAGFQV